MSATLHRTEGATTSPQPLYYVRHPDGSFSVAAPQPTAEQIAAQNGDYAQCDGAHAGSCCEDPCCHRVCAGRVAVPAAPNQGEAS